MRCLERNKQKLYYALYVGKTANTDDEGDMTGEFSETYGEPTALMANISPNRGQASLEPFGVATAYTNTIVTDDMSCPINPNSRLWIGKEPYIDNVLQPHNYVAVKVAKSINSIEIAVNEVEVS